MMTIFEMNDDPLAILLASLAFTSTGANPKGMLSPLSTGSFHWRTATTRAIILLKNWLSRSSEVEARKTLKMEILVN